MKNKSFGITVNPLIINTFVYLDPSNYKGTDYLFWRNCQAAIDRSQIEPYCKFPQRAMF